MMITTSKDTVLQILPDRLQSYLDGAEDLPSFTAWVTAQVLAPIADDGDERPEVALTYQIGLRLFEAKDGIWTEPELRRELRRLLRLWPGARTARVAS